MSSSVYVHVPFCLTRCRYCAFYSGEPLDLLGGYAELLCAEIRMRSRSEFAHGPVDTVYFGGGTPSLLEPRAVAAVLDAVNTSWGLAAGAEVSLEVNPSPGVDLWGLRAAGVTRISVGVQSLDDSRLAFLGRTHSAREAMRSLKAAAEAGMETVAADLMYGLPEVENELLERSVRILTDLGVSHLSAYCLEVHPGTPIAEERGLPLPAEQEQVQWERLAEAAHREGLEAYEISNFGRPGCRCRHNLAYWDRSPYLGLGPGAHGFAPHRGPWGERFWNTPGLAAYRACLDEGRPLPGGGERLLQREALLEVLFLALRQSRPLDTGLLCRSFRLDRSAVADCFAVLGSHGYARDVGYQTWVPTHEGMSRADGLAAWIHGRLLAGSTAATP